MSRGRLVEDEDGLAALVRAMRVVAVVGIKDERRPDEPAYSVPARLVALGLDVIPVNPKLTAALGRPAWPDLASVPRPFDTVDIFRRSENIPAHADEILALPPARRPAVVWMQTGIRHDQAAERLIEAGVTVVMDRCLGVIAGRHLVAPRPGRA
jgi:predicted CoA-binding protein